VAIIEILEIDYGETNLIKMSVNRKALVSSFGLYYSKMMFAVANAAIPSSRFFVI